MVILKGTPAVWGLEIGEKVKWSRAAGLTSKVLDTPTLPLPLAVIVLANRDLVIVILITPELPF